jgi:hypothetical protein
MDYFHRNQIKYIGVGGVNCNCCNDFCWNVDNKKQKKVGRQKLHRACRRVDKYKMHLALRKGDYDIYSN